MDKEKGLPKRKNIRLKNYDYSSPGAYFVTICTEKRKNLFWHGDFNAEAFSWLPVGANCVRPQNLPLSKVGKIVLEELESWNRTYSAVSLYSYIIMPNHLHVMIVITADEYGRPQVAPTVERMVKQFKGSVTKKVGRSIWQKSFIEHVIRNKKDYETRSNYIYENPIKWRFDELYCDLQETSMLSEQELLNMTPGELVDLGICPTCFNREHNGAIYGDNKDKMLYEDNDIECFFVGAPRAEGHMCISTMQHYHDMSEAPDEINQKIIRFAKQFMIIIKRIYACERVYMCTMCDGPNNHYHIQLIPRYSFEERGSKNFVKQRKPYIRDDEKLQMVKKAIAEYAKTNK